MTEGFLKPNAKTAFFKAILNFNSELNVMPKRCASRFVKEIQELQQAYEKLIKNKLLIN